MTAWPVACRRRPEPRCASERPPVASVAADTSAIAPPSPLPSRPDAGPPAGQSGAFADLLDASAAPAPAPQLQGPPGGRPDDGANTAQDNAAAGSTPASSGASSSARNGKDSGGSKSADDPADDNNAGNTGVGVTVVAGFPVPPFAFAPLPAGDQTPTASQDTPTASLDAAASTQDGTGAPPSNHKDSDAPTDSSPAGLAAAIPGLVPVVTVVAPAAAAGTGPVASLPSGATVPAGTSSAPSASAPAAGDDADIAAPATQPPDGAGQNSQPASASVLNFLTDMPSAASTPPAAGALQMAAVRGLASATAGNAALDRNAQPAPAASAVITADAPPGTGAPAAAAMTALAAANQAAAETLGNPAPPRDAGAVQIALPAQVAVRFAAATHADADADSDSGTDVLRGFGGAGAGATTPPGSGQPGDAIASNFTGILSTMQAAPGGPTAPQHAAVTTDSVPLAAVPIAIVTRAEAGERKFEIRLDPPDLGRIEVQLNVDSSGRATSHLVVDRAATLDLLRRDAPALERALQSAGLTTDNGSLQFSLRDQSFAGREQAPPAPVATPATPSGAESEIAPIDAALRRYGAAAGLGGGIDIRV